MTLALAIALYFILWWVCLFAVLPFAIRTQDEHGEVVPGTPGSAPHAFPFWRVVLVNTLIASLIYAVLYYVVASGWVKIEDLSPLNPMLDRG